MPEDTTKPARKRQARGEKRMEELLDAAAEVFAAQGYAKASTNAIAAEAGASPGTLYQFFKNKQQIAEALTARYVERLEAAHGKAFSLEVADLPLSVMLRRIIDPLVDFDRANPGFYALLTDPSLSPDLASAKKPVQKLMFERLDKILGRRAPDLPEEHRARTAEVAVHLFRGMLPLIMSASEAELPAVVGETKLALHSYLSVALKRIADPAVAEADALASRSDVTTDDIVSAIHEAREERMRAIEDALGWDHPREDRP